MRKQETQYLDQQKFEWFLKNLNFLTTEQLEETDLAIQAELHFRDNDSVPWKE